MCKLVLCVLIAAAILSPRAYADHGALSLDAGGGGVGLLLATPQPPGFALTATTTTPVISGTAWLGARYAISNSIEIAVSGFFEPSVQVFHNGVVLDSTAPPMSSFPGTLSHRDTGYGALAGARWLHGDVWRFTVACDIGWARRSYSGFIHYDDRSSSGAVDYRLSLRDLVVDSALLSLGGGLEWAFADKMSVSVLPRFQLAVGSGVVPSLMVPVVFSYSWFL